MFSWFKKKTTDDNNEVSPKLKWHEFNKDEQHALINGFVSRIKTLEDKLQFLTDELGETAAYCDKCDGNKSMCFKCNNTGVIKRKQLFSWSDMSGSDNEEDIPEL